MDNHAWKSKVMPIMGYQRSPEARQLNNQDRQKRINSLKPKKVYDNKLFKHSVDNKYLNSIPKLMSQKVKIRARRNQLAELQVPATARTISSSTINQYERKYMQQRMSKTVQDWISTKTTFYPPLSARQKSQVNPQQTLQDWYRTTCSSKWIFRKSPKLDTDEQSLHETQQNLLA